MKNFIVGLTTHVSGGNMITNEILMVMSHGALVVTSVIVIAAAGIALLHSRRK